MQLKVMLLVNSTISRDVAPTIEELEAKPVIGADGMENTRFACGEAIPKEWINGPYMQIELYLGAVNSGTTPRITEIIVE